MVLEIRCDAVSIHDNDRVSRGLWSLEQFFQLNCDSFIVFPSTFTNASGITVNQNIVGIVAIVLLALGYTLSVALWFICASWLFQLDVIFL